VHLDKQCGQENLAACCELASEANAISALDKWQENITMEENSIKLVSKAVSVALYMIGK